MHVDRRIRFEYAMCGRGNFLNPERKSCGFKTIWIHVDRAYTYLLDIDFIYKIPLLAQMFL